MIRMFSLVCACTFFLSFPSFAGIQAPSIAGAGASSLSGSDAPSTPSTPATPADTVADAATTNPESAKRCLPTCYNTPNAKAGCDVSNACQKFDAAHPGYFEGIDKSCNLPAGTAIKFAQIESSCRVNAATKTGTYRGLFQFSKTSCPGGNLHDMNQQAACMCDYTANSRRQYKNATGQTPSAGMYYLIHQQGGCGIKLATGGGNRAVDVLSQCVSRSKCGHSGGCAKSMRYAAAAIGGNIPRSSGFNASTISAQQFANIYLSKFAGIDNSNICSGDGPPAFATGGSEGGFNQILAGTSALTASGSPWSPSFLNTILGSDDISSIFQPILNSRYDEDSDDYDEDNDTGGDGDTPPVDVTTRVTVVFNDDGTKTVNIVAGNTTASYEVALGHKLWNCEGTYQLVENGSLKETELDAARCEVVAEGKLEDAKNP